MKKIFGLMMLILFADESLSAELPPETKTSVAGGSRTLLEIQLNNAMQDMRPANREIAALKEFQKKIPEIVKKIGDAKMPEKPKIFEEAAQALEDLKNLKGDTLLDPTTNPVVKNVVDKCRAVTRLRTPSLPSEVLADIRRNREDANISLILESVQFTDPPSKFKTEKMDELITTLGRYENDKWIPSSPLPSRQKVEAQIQPAIAEAKGLGKQFEDSYNALKSAVKEYYNNVTAAVAADVTRRETLLAQQVKTTEELAKQIADLEKAQSLNVGDLIQKLPILVGILCGLFVGLILLIRFYPPDLQTEWVASGQVIQLLTVVTLLLIILCLAVTHVINENTIGTLLGGIGGYVLSQGIGRAAAREATRSKTL